MYEGIHAMCEAPATAPDGTPLSCMRSDGHPERLLHADKSEGYVWVTGGTPYLED